MNKSLCFAENIDTVKEAFRDYMFQYMAEQMSYDNVSYNKMVDFAEKEKLVNKLMLDEIKRLSNVDFSSGLSMEMMSQNPNFKWAAFAVVNSLIDMIIPDVINRTIGLYSETRYVGWGDSMVFEVEPNDLFYVSKAGRDQRTVEFQRQYNTQVSVLPENREITVYVNFYRVLCGMDSLAKFVMKAILSMEQNMTQEVYDAFNAVMDNLPDTPAGSNLRVAGWSQQEAVRLAQTVTAYNHGSKAVFVGTQAALQNVLPDNANYRYFLDSEYVRMGFIKNAFGYDCYVLPQIADWKNLYTLGLRDDRIYVLSPASQSMIKIVYEGNTMSNTIPAQQSANLTEQTTITKSYGIGLATNAVAGVITL